MSIYADIIIDHYQFPRHKGKLPNPTATTHVSNPLCGDELDLQINVLDDVVKDIAFDGTGCAISLASASMLCEYVLGKKTDFVRALTPARVVELLGIEFTPNRLKCALLALEGMHSLFSKKTVV